MHRTQISGESKILAEDSPQVVIRLKLLMQTLMVSEMDSVGRVIQDFLVMRRLIHLVIRVIPSQVMIRT